MYLRFAGGQERDPMELSVKSDKSDLSKKTYTGPSPNQLSTADGRLILEAHAAQGDEGAQYVSQWLPSARRK